MSKARNQVRIIGGRWRGRNIHFPDAEGLHPTGNRVRETLFNWLMLPIKNAVCLDIFAGSGALSFEALSRGAKSVTAWDASKSVIEHLFENANTLKAEGLMIEHLHFPKEAPLFEEAVFDIAFVDPPFHKNWIKKTCQWLSQSGCLKEGALIYIESEKNQKLVDLPENFEIIKEKTAGDVRFFLLKNVQSPSPLSR